MLSRPAGYLELGQHRRISDRLSTSDTILFVMRDKKARIGQGAAGRLTLVKKTEIVRSITAIHHEKTGAPRYLIPSDLLRRRAGQSLRHRPTDACESDMDSDRPG